MSYEFGSSSWLVESICLKSLVRLCILMGGGGERMIEQSNQIRNVDRLKKRNKGSYPSFKSTFSVTRRARPSFKGLYCVEIAWSRGPDFSHGGLHETIPLFWFVFIMYIFRGWSSCLLIQSSGVTGVHRHVSLTAPHFYSTNTSVYHCNNPLKEISSGNRYLSMFLLHRRKLKL